MTNLSISDPIKWLQLWDDALTNSPMKKRQRHTPEQQVERWNQRAKSFDANRQAQSKVETRQKVISLLSERGVLNKQARVLDVGAGSGAYAVLLAQRVGEVTAVEPADEMVRIFRSKIEADKITNIQIIQKTWQQIDLEKDNMKGQYDLVFASMTPGVSNAADLIKLIQASKKTCYMSTHLGLRWDHAKELWHRFFNEDMGDNPRDVIYPFSLLNALGYQPNTVFLSGRTQSIQSADSIAEDLIWFFSSYLEVTPDTEKIIRDYANNLHLNKAIAQKSRGSSAVLIWDVD